MVTWSMCHQVEVSVQISLEEFPGNFNILLLRSSLHSNLLGFKPHLVLQFFSLFNLAWNT